MVERVLQRWGVAAGLVVGCLLSAAPAPAQPLTSPNFELRGATLSGGGAVNLRSGTPGSQLGAVGVTLGESSPLGVAQGPVTGTTLESGFWPAAVPVPESATGAGLIVAALALLPLARRRSTAA